MGREQGRVTDLVGKMIHASTRISYLKILEVCDRESSVKVKISTFFFHNENSGLIHGCLIALVF
jgi:hypothetical protein